MDAHSQKPLSWWSIPKLGIGDLQLLTGLVRKLSNRLKNRCTLFEKFEVEQREERKPCLPHVLIEQ